MKPWIFNCKEVSRLVSESLDRELSLPQKIGIRMHLFMCNFCSLYKKQIIVMRDAMRLLAQVDEFPEPAVLSSEAKRRIKRLLTVHQETGSLVD